MRLIDADDTIREIALNFSKKWNSFSKSNAAIEATAKAIHCIENMPTIDAVPVVRCKDCFYHGDFDENGYCVCECTGAGMPMHGFCSDGERKKWL